MVASQTTCSGQLPLTHQLWSVDSDDEGVYTCRMELSNGTTVEQNISQPLNVVGKYVSIFKYMFITCCHGNIWQYNFKRYVFDIMAVAFFLYTC